VAQAQHLPLHLHLQHQLAGLTSHTTGNSSGPWQFALTPARHSVATTTTSSSLQDCTWSSKAFSGPQAPTSSHDSTSYRLARQQVAARAAYQVPKPLLQNARSVTSITLDVLQLPSLLAAAARDRSILALLVLGVTRLQLVGDVPVTLRDILQPGPPSASVQGGTQGLADSKGIGILHRVKALAAVITKNNTSSSRHASKQQAAATSAAAARGQQQLEQLLAICCNLEHLDLTAAPQLHLPAPATSGSSSSSGSSGDGWVPPLRSLHLHNLDWDGSKSPTRPHTTLAHLTHLVLTHQCHPVEWVGWVCTNLVALELHGPPLDAQHQHQQQQQQQQKGPAATATAAAAGAAACQVPHTLSRLTQLQRLTLQRLPGVAAQLASLAAPLTRLQQLDISRCGLRALPEGLGHLPELQVLRAAHNALPSISPTAARQLGGVTALDLSGNFGVALGALSALQQLQHLQLSRCGLKTLEQLSGLRALSHLDASHNCLRCVGGLAAAAQGLTFLDLSHNPGQCLAGLTSWARPQQLQELHLDMPLQPAASQAAHGGLHKQQQQQQQQLLAPLQGLSCVTRVTLSWALVTDNPGWLQQQPALVALRLGTHGLRGSCCNTAATKWLHLGRYTSSHPHHHQHAALQLPTQLQEVSLCGLPHLPSALSALVHLRHLDLSRTKAWQAPLRALPTWLTALQQLEVLDISGNVLRHPPWRVVEQLPSLVTLRALGCGCGVPARLQHMTWV
jgi:Leucine-rich repeat (LRR) protein